LEVLGDGNQSKPYILVNDLVDGIILGFKKSKDEINYFNIEMILIIILIDIIYFFTGINNLFHLIIIKNK
jgi:UDP-glucose 4-epimerase